MDIVQKNEKKIKYPQRETIEKGKKIRMDTKKTKNLLKLNNIRRKLSTCFILLFRLLQCL